MGCIEADHVLLGELALLGEVIEIPEVLYGPNYSCKMLEIMDPSKMSGKALFPSNYMDLEASPSFLKPSSTNPFVRYAPACFGSAVAGL